MSLRLVPLEAYLRSFAPRPDDLVVRGSPLSIDGLLRHASRTAKVFSWRGSPALAISASLTESDDEVDGLLRSVSLRTRSTFGATQVGRLRLAGFDVVATFSSPHVSIVWPQYDRETAAKLASALSPVRNNPHFGRRTR
jgi:hypothetical protein